MRAVDAWTRRTLLTVLRLRLTLLIARVTLLIARVTLLIARVTLLIAGLTVLRLTLLITRVSLLIAGLAVLRLTLLVAGLAGCLLITRSLAVAWRTLITLLARRLFGTGSACGGSAFLSAVVAIFALGIIALLFARYRGLTIRIVRDGVAILVTTTTAATTTTTTTTTFAWDGGVIGMTFTRRRCAIVCEIRDRGGVEDFRFGGCRVRHRSDQVAGRDLFRFVGRSESGSRSSSGRAGFTSSRRGCRGEVSGEHALQRLDEIVFAEPATILNLMFAGELSEVFDAKSGEIRLIRHGSNSPAQTLRDARLVRRDEWPIYGLCC